MATAACCRHTSAWCWKRHEPDTRDAVTLPPDWTRGEPGLTYQACARCAARWAFARPFCPRCGVDASAEETLRAANGMGIVRARTVVHRAPDAEFRGIVPYCLVLVDLDETVRVMGHAGADVAIGERVRCRFHQIAGRLLPCFEKSTEDPA